MAAIEHHEQPPWLERRDGLGKVGRTQRRPAPPAFLDVVRDEVVVGRRGSAFAPAVARIVDDGGGIAALVGGKLLGQPLQAIQDTLARGCLPADNPDMFGGIGAALRMDENRLERGNILGRDGQRLSRNGVFVDGDQ